jgi:YidC/Oxa1 family membrane protein insertase
MEQTRLLLAIVLSLVIFLVWQFFFAPPTVPPPPTDKETPAAVQPPSEKAAPAGVDAQAAGTPPSPQPAFHAAADARTLRVQTPLYAVDLSENGAVFTGYMLKQYRESVGENSPAKHLMPDDHTMEALRIGMQGQSLPGLEKAIFSADVSTDTVEVQSEPRRVSFSWESPDGVRVEKTYRFSPDSYVVDLDIGIINRSGRTIQDNMYITLTGKVPQDSRVYGFEGPSALIDDTVEEIKIKKLDEKNTFTGPIRWVGMQDRYFFESIIPSQVQDATLKLFLKSQDILEAQYLQPESVIPTGNEYHYQYQVFYGPKSMKVLRAAGNSLSKALDFGMFDVLAKPCLWLMNFLYSFIPNYGVAIIILTILIKVLLWPLGNKSYKSMNAMKKLQPLMQEIRQKYKNDKKKMNEEVMALYRTYKINPMGGCLPMVVQIPVFFALYRMLYSAIELRHAPFFGWINDLAAPDRLFRFGFEIPFMQAPYGIPVLTLVMGATMLLQQKMSPPMGDPTQAKMMMLMPVVFTVIFINFSSGLVLYWLVNNVLSIAQQYYVQKKFS